MSENGTVTGIERVLALIEANQHEFEAADRSWKRFIPLWRVRRQYRLCKANEPLFEALGNDPEPPFFFETARGLHWSILRKMIGA